MKTPAITVLVAATFAFATPGGDAMTVRMPERAPLVGPEKRPAAILVEFSQVGVFPLFTTESLTVRSDASAELRSLRRGKWQNTSFVLSSSTFDRLKSTLRNARVGSLRSRYMPANGCVDGSVYSITWAGRTVTTDSCLTHELVPQRLYRVIALLNRLVASHPTTPSG
jgi:hypothetical protein